MFTVLIFCYHSFQQFAEKEGFESIKSRYDDEGLDAPVSSVIGSIEEYALY